jgi:hypothetical protein
VDTFILKRHFARIGAELNVVIRPAAAQRFSRPVLQRDRGLRDFALDVTAQRRTEVFTLAVREDVQDDLDFVALDVQPKARHLLLMARRPTAFDKFLCGHDERHWFVTGLPNDVRTVRDALEALKPQVVQTAQLASHLRGKERVRRRNAAFLRQGEWFFLPRSQLAVDEHLILRHEPIQRSGSKPHIVAELYRQGGEAVYVHNRFAPGGLPESEYRAFIQRTAEANGAGWRLMRRNMEVYARGKVRHPDHATLALPFWHLVVMNAEPRSENVVFLD